jgi:hypothetical protein
MLSEKINMGIQDRVILINESGESMIPFVSLKMAGLKDICK